MLVKTSSNMSKLFMQFFADVIFINLTPFVYSIKCKCPMQMKEYSFFQQFAIYTIQFQGMSMSGTTGRLPICFFEGCPESFCLTVSYIVVVVLLCLIRPSSIIDSLLLLSFIWCRFLDVPISDFFNSIIFPTMAL